MTRPWRLTLVLGLAALGCTRTPAPPELLPELTEALRVGNFTYAIYNSDNELISSPIRDLEKYQRETPPTDVYVIAHGWNYTTAEAISNYYKYLAVAQQNGKLIGEELEQHPYFVFLVWSSISRPITAAAKSIVPYGIDDLLTLEGRPVRTLSRLRFQAPQAKARPSRVLPRVPVYNPTAPRNREGGSSPAQLGRSDPSRSRTETGSLRRNRR